jgi:hypothetical protein
MDELTRRFKYHAPNEATKAIHNQLRDEALQFAAGVIEELPGASREKSLAMTKFEEAMFWAHAHVARNVGREE